MQKNFLKLLTALVLTLVFGVSAQAAGIVLSPPKFEFTGDKGQIISGVVHITNKEDSTLVLGSDVQDFIAGGETGQPTFLNSDENTHPSLSLAKWITVNGGESVSIKPGEKKEIPFTITIPENAEPGGHYGSIFFFPPAGDGQVAVVQKIGSLVLVRVNGEIRKEGALLSFGAYPKEMTGEEISQSSSQSFFTKLPVNFSVRFQNTGNIHVKPTGTIKLFGTFGSEIAPTGVKALVNEKGLKLGEEIVDYLPINDGKGNVLASSIRRFDSTWNGTPFWYKNDFGTKEIHFNGGVENYSEKDLIGKFSLFLDRIKSTGIYSAEMTLLGANGEEIKEKISFTIFPFYEIFGGIFGLVILIFGLIKYKAWSRKRLEAQIRKQMETVKIK